MAESYRLASAGGDVKIWEMPGLTLAKTLDIHSQAVSSLSWSPNNLGLATAAADKVVVTYFKGSVVNTVDVGVGENNSCVAFNSTSRFLLTGGKSRILSVWDLKAQCIKKTYKEHTDAVSCLTFNWNDTTTASGSVNGNILLHNIVTGQATGTMRLPKTQAVRDIQFSYFKKSLLGAVSDDGALNLWDCNTRKLMASFSSDHSAPATGLSFSPMNDMLLASVGLDKKIIFYDVQGKKPVKVMTAESPLTSVDFRYDGATLAVGSTKGKIFVYDLRSGSSPINSTTAHSTSVQYLSFQNSSSAGTKGSSNAVRSKVTKPTPSTNAKPPIRHLPSPQLAAVSPIPTPPANGGEHKTHTQQNGLKEEEEEEIFSPLREVKPPAVPSSVNAPEKYVARPGLERDTENNTADGIFSPLISDSATHPVRHHPVGAPSSGVSSARRLNAEIRSEFPRTTGEVTPVDNVATSVDMKEQDVAILDTRPSEDESRRNEGVSLAGNGAVDRKCLSDAPPPAFSRSPALRVRHGSSGRDHKSPNASPSLARKALVGNQGPNERQQVSPEINERTNEGAAMATATRTTEGAVLDAGTSAESAGLAPFQVQFIKNMIEDSLEEFKFGIHRDLVNVQVEMLRQFQIQQNELKALMEKYSMNEALVLEIERLKEENHRLKTKY